MTTDHDVAARSAPSSSSPTGDASAGERTVDLLGHRRLSVASPTWLGDRAWLWFSAGLVVLLLGLLIGPRVPERAQKDHCVGNIELAGPFGLSLNCDSPQFMWLARQPEGLLEHRNARQSRPGMIVAAALLTRPLSLVAPPGGPPLPVTQGLLETERITPALARDLPAYLAYILLNGALLLLCFHFVRKMVAPAGVNDGPGMVIVAAIGLLLIGNDVTKAFFWSPHMQLFNVFVPVLALYATLRVFDGAPFDRTFALGLGLAIGLGVTAYGVFIVIPICLLLPWIWALAREPKSARRRHALANLALLLALSIAPMALWYLFVVRMTGQFFHIEADHFGQVMWILSALEQGSFLRRFFMTLGELLGFAAPQALPLAMLLGMLAILAWHDRDAAAGLRAAFPVALVALYVSAAFLGFYTCVGWYSDRLAYPAIPPLLIAAGAAAATMVSRMDPLGCQRLTRGCAGLALANLIWVVIKDGPWS
jgi:hypothetical protein